MARVTMDTDFEPGDFVRLRISPTGRVGVLSRVDPEGTASVRVYWHRGLGLSMTDAYKPDDLRLVPSEDVPEYAVALKRSLEL